MAEVGKVFLFPFSFVGLLVVRDLIPVSNAWQEKRGLERG